MKSRLTLTLTIVYILSLSLAANNGSIDSSVSVNFSTKELIIDCNYTIQFTDSSILSSTTDQISTWEWDFGDGTRKSLLQNPSHTYTQGGNFDVKLIILTDTGSTDSLTKRIYISGPQPDFENDLWWSPLDTFTVCSGDSLLFQNISQGDINSPSFQMDWGDGSFSTAAAIGDFYGHQYTKVGTFELFLTQEDEIPGTGIRCSRIFPDTNPDLITQYRIVVIVISNPDVKITGRTTPTYQRHPTSFIAEIDSSYTRMNWYVTDGIITDTVFQHVPDNMLIYQFPNIGTYNVILAPQYDIIPRCWDRDTFHVIVQNASLNPVSELEPKITIYPNPGNEEVFISLTAGVKLIQVSMIDLVGKETQLKYSFNSNSLVQVNTRDLASGSYQFKIETDSGIIFKKIVILKE